MKRSPCSIYFTSIILLTLVLLTSGCPQPANLVTVPDVVGMPLSVAQAEIEVAGLVVGTVTEENHATIPPGEVISQMPQAGAEVNNGTAVNLVVSTGPRMVIVPNVVGMTQSSAQAEIEAADLEVGTVSEENHTTIPPGEVISQEPVAGLEVLNNTTVTLVVSSGPRMVTMPDVVGMSQSAAIAELEVADLLVGIVTEENHATIPPGDVIRQEPEAGTAVPQNTSVNLVISIGSGLVTVPDVVGMSQSIAQAEIEVAGLTVGTVSEQHHDTIPAGQVISQNPEAGEVVSQLTPVNLSISIGEFEAMEMTFLLPGDVPLIMVWIPPGSFMMGRYFEEQDSHITEDPQREVTIANGFWIGKYPITQEQWQAVMGNNPSNFIGENLPVERVSWKDVRETDGFLDQLNALSPEYNFRLPSEAEWEYAYRAGTTTRFYWGDDPEYTEIDNYAWYRNNSDTGNGRETHPVGLKLPNAWGLYDMAGNVWEWCEDDWHDNYNGAPNDGSAWVYSPRGNGRMLRGGTWFYNPNFCRASYRFVSDPDYRIDDFGFRVVCTLD